MKKKILITGFNRSQCTRNYHITNSQLKIVPSHYSLYNCLYDMGYDVEQREVVIGEDLSQYDDVIVFIAGARQLVTTRLYNGLWAIANRPDCIIATDDWQVPDLFKSITKCQDTNELTAPFILGTNKTTVEELTPYMVEFEKAVNVVSAKKNRMLISAFQTGHLNDPINFGPQLLFDGINYPLDRLFVYNPEGYHRVRTPSDPGHSGIEDPHFVKSPFDMDEECIITKERRFNFASLVQSKTKKWLKSQGINTKDLDKEEAKIQHWIVDLYGSKADSQKRLTEDQMVLTFARDWGCLMPGYDHAGSGWWRSKPRQSAEAGSILIGEPKEMMVYYNDEYLSNLKAKDIVDMDDDELAALAEAQKEALYKNHPFSKDTQKAELAAILGAER